MVSIALNCLLLTSSQQDFYFKQIEPQYGVLNLFQILVDLPLLRLHLHYIFLLCLVCTSESSWHTH